MLSWVKKQLHAWIVSKRCLGVVKGVQHLLGVREDKQGLHTTPLIHAYFKMASVLGSEVFYVVFLPIVIWMVDFEVGRRALVFWSLLFYLGNAGKDLFCLPRPLCPPVYCLEHGDYTAEYGLPSVHALGTFVPLFCLLEEGQGSALVAWLVFASSVCLSRLYLGVHSVPDLVAGLGLGLLCLWGGCEGSRAFEAMATGHALGPVLVLATTLALILVYPRPDKATPTCGFTVSILGATGGVLLAHAYIQLQSYHAHGGVLHPSLSVLLHPPSPSSPIEWALVAARLLTGLSLLVLTKTLAKPMAQGLVGSLKLGEGGVGSFTILTPLPAAPDNKAPHMTGKELLVKWVSYFALGWAVVHSVPLAWTALGLAGEGVAEQTK